MYTSLLFIIFFSFYILYNTSKKEKIHSSPSWISYFNKHPKLTKILSIIILTVATLFMCIHQGISSAIFSLIVYMMGILSLIVLLCPFNMIKWTNILFIFLLFIGIELIFVNPLCYAC